MNAALQNHRDRMQRVLDHIDRHLEEALDLETLSGVAACSKFHFHRQFTAAFGVPVHRYVQLARLKRASHKLAYRDSQSITEIAMDAGYEAPDAFARAFRQRFGQSPSSFRESPGWAPWLDALHPFDAARRALMRTDLGEAAEVAVREVPSTRVAIMAHRGDPALLGDTIQRFIAWRKAAGLHPRHSPTFNVWRSQGSPLLPEDPGVDLCAGADGPIQAHGHAIRAGEIPGGRCAVLRVVGHTDDLEPAAMYLYRDWLPRSGEALRDFPMYCQRLSFFPDVPAHEAVADLFLPLK